MTVLLGQLFACRCPFCTSAPLLVAAASREQPFNQQSGQYCSLSASWKHFPWLCFDRDTSCPSSDVPHRKRYPAVAVLSLFPAEICTADCPSAPSLRHFWDLAGRCFPPILTWHGASPSASPGQGVGVRRGRTGAAEPHRSADFWVGGFSFSQKMFFSCDEEKWEFSVEKPEFSIKHIYF